MATLIKVGESPVKVTVASSDDIKKYIGAKFLDMLPLGNDPKKPIDKTVWLNEDRELLELEINKEATTIVETLTTPTVEAMTHRMWAVDEEGNEIPVESKVDTPTVFPPIRGDVIITDFLEDGL